MLSAQHADSSSLIPVSQTWLAKVVTCSLLTEKVNMYLYLPWDPWSNLQPTIYLYTVHPCTFEIQPYEGPNCRIRASSQWKWPFQNFNVHGTYQSTTHGLPTICDRVSQPIQLHIPRATLVQHSVVLVTRLTRRI